MIYSEPSVEFDRYIHIPLPIVTKHELGLLFPLRNRPIKFGTNPSTIFLVIVVTDRQTHTNRQTHKPTPVKTYSFAFTGITIYLLKFLLPVLFEYSSTRWDTRSSTRVINYSISGSLVLDFGLSERWSDQMYIVLYFHLQKLDYVKLMLMFKIIC